MKSRIAFGLVIVTFLAGPIGVHAQLRGLLKKKAGEIIGGKPAAPAPAGEGKSSEPAPTPTQTPDATSSEKAQPSRGLDDATTLDAVGGYGIPGPGY